MPPTVKKFEPTRRYTICSNYDGIEMYSRIPLIQLAWDWTGAKLLNIPDYQTLPILTQDLTGNFLLMLLYFGCTTNQRSIPLGYLLHQLVQSHQGLPLCFLESS
jgi:hypothetical protein